MQKYNRTILLSSAALGVGLLLLGLLVDGICPTLRGMKTILTIQDLLITDYMDVAGFGAAMANAGLVTLASAFLIRLSGDPCNGFTIAEVGLMAGFSLFGKNIFNIWPILGGTWVYARFRREPFSKYLGVGLLATSLSPLVSYMAFGSTHGNVAVGTLVGLAVGFLLPPLAAYTFKILNGMNLYNMGFACGLLAMVVVPILAAVGDKPQTVLLWSVDYGRLLGWLLAAGCAALILIGWRLGSGSAWRSWWHLIKTSGRAPSDYLLQFGAGPVLINMGINGLIGVAYILLAGGELNGPTVGGILTLMGFAAYGKHMRNILPIMVGVALGAFGMHRTPDAPSLQLAGLFGTTLAPIAGQFGWFAGVLAGFLHSAVVVQTSGPVAGLNLYNNGFSGGLITMVLYPVLTALARRRSPIVREQDYFEVIMADEQEQPEDERPADHGRAAQEQEHETNLDGTDEATEES